MIKSIRQAIRGTNPVLFHGRLLTWPQVHDLLKREIDVGEPLDLRTLKGNELRVHLGDRLVKQKVLMMLLPETLRGDLRAAFTELFEGRLQVAPQGYRSLPQGLKLIAQSPSLHARDWGRFFNIRISDVLLENEV